MWSISKKSDTISTAWQFELEAGRQAIVVHGQHFRYLLAGD
jgi:hypothetical protein